MQIFLLRGFPNCRQTVVRGFASLLHHRCLYERESRDEREKNAGWGAEWESAKSMPKNTTCVSGKKSFWETFLEDEKFKTQ
jgi:hypothetical protein